MRHGRFPDSRQICRRSRNRALKDMNSLPPAKKRRIGFDIDDD
jgi:hypothetical protein